MPENSFQFYNRAKIVSGNRALEGIPLELAEYSRKRPFVLSAAGEESRNSTKRFRDALCDSGMAVPAFWNGAVSGDDMTLAHELASIFISRNCDSLIAIGGGNTLKISRHIRKITGGDKEHTPLFLVPTAVISDIDLCVSDKADSAITGPDVIFIDPSIKTPASERAYVNACLAAFARAVEGSFSAANPLTGSFRTSAVSLLHSSIPAFLMKPGNSAARSAVINGIIHGGIALGNSEAGIVHHLGESIARESGADSGVVMIMLLLPVIEYRIEEGQICDPLLMALAGIDRFCSVQAKERPGETLHLLNTFIKTVLNSISGSMRDIHLHERSLKEILSSAEELTGVSSKKLSGIVAEAGISCVRGGKR